MSADTPKHPKRGSGWGPRTFTPEQWLKRDIRSAATRAEKDMKAGKRPITLAKIGGEKATND